MTIFTISFILMLMRALKVDFSLEFKYTKNARTYTLDFLKGVTAAAILYQGYFWATWLTNNVL